MFISLNISACLNVKLNPLYNYQSITVFYNDNQNMQSRCVKLILKEYVKCISGNQFLFL